MIPRKQFEEKYLYLTMGEIIMKKISRIIIVMLLLNILLGATGCKMVDSYKKFCFKNISDNHDENYFTSENLEFARLANVVFIPEIKEINHGEYIIYISAYSETGTEQILVKNVMLKEDEEVLLDYDLNKNILLEENSNSVYEGCIDGGTFTDEKIEIVDGKEFDLVIQVELEKDGTIVSKDITFETSVKGYKSFVMPT